MPCGRGWLENTQTSYEDTKFVNRETLVDALVAMGFTKDQITISVDGEILGVYARHFGGQNTLIFKRGSKNNYVMTVGEDDLAILNKRHSRGFRVGLNTNYSLASVAKIAKSRGGTIARKSSGNVMYLTVRSG